jgi:hypothetical protein
MFWRNHTSGKFLILNYIAGLQDEETQLCQKSWKKFGALFAVQFLRLAIPPPRLSPWVTLALLAPTFAPPFSLIRKFEPNLAEHLAAWFERPDGPICSVHLETSPDGKATPIDWLIGEVFNNQTVCRTCSCLT